MRKSIYLLTTTPTSHTHRFHPLPLATPTSCSPHPLATPIHSTHSPQLSSILLTCAKFKVWMTTVESGWNVWVWLLGVVVRRYIDFLILLIPTSLVSVIFCSSIPTFCSFLKMFYISIYIYIYPTVYNILSDITCYIDCSLYFHCTVLCCTVLYVHMEATAKVCVVPLLGSHCQGDSTQPILYIYIYISDLLRGTF